MNDNVKLYSGNFQPSEFGSTLAEYIFHTTIVKENQAVKKFIHYYLWKLEKNNVLVTKSVREVLNNLLSDQELLDKIQIVAYCAWRNFVVYIRPNHLSYSGEFETAMDAIENYKHESNVIFLCLHEPFMNSFVHPTVMIEETKQLAHALINEKETWQANYEQLRSEKINQLLDEYNRCEYLYDPRKKQIMTMLKGL